MSYLLAGGSLVLIVLVLVDVFVAMLLPRRITHQFRFARLFYAYSWRPWAALAPACDRASGGTPSSASSVRSPSWC
jgi:hypothetical protein